MGKIYCILLISLLTTTDFAFGQYCDTSQDTFQAYNLGRNVYIGQGAIAIWLFDVQLNQVIGQKLSLKEVFGENIFEWVDTAFCFNFGECHTKDSASNCEVINKARNLVVVIGQKKQETGSRKYGYLLYRMDSNKLLERVNDTDLAWGLSQSGTVTGNFWVSLPGDLYYESSVFVVSRNLLIVSVYDTSSNSDSKYHLMSRKLEPNGQWALKWVEISKRGFRGMFEVKNRVFGMDKKNIVYEFIWSSTEDITFKRMSNMKELLNCFGNTTFGELAKNNSDLILSTTSDEMVRNSSEVTLNETSDSLMTTIDTTETPINISIATETETENEEITTEEVMNLNDSDNSTAEATKQDDKQITGTVFLVIGLILLITIVAIILIIIFRKKTKSQIIYLNSTSEQTPKQRKSDSLKVKSIRSKL